MDRVILSEKRAAKFKEVVRKSQPNLTVILENVHDSHNIGAVLRTCDSVGIREVFVLYTEKDIKKLTLGKRTSAGARKWIDVHLYHDIEKCLEHVRKSYDKIYATHLTEDAVSLYDLDLTESVALVFGNESNGISQEILKRVDGNFIVPQVGMVESLNISVACAVSLYEGFRQRREKGYYSDNPPLSEAQQEALFDSFQERTTIKFYNYSVDQKG